jgi:signal transduction histidine kinase/CheY-like chemotaxis protein/HAMP domain-containing protein
MRINYRIVIINFIVVLLVLPATAILYYSILSDSLISIQKKNLSVSLNNFISTIQTYSQQLDNSFYQFYRKSNDFNNKDLNKLDFIFLSEGEILKPIFVSEELRLPTEQLSISRLKSSFSNLYIKKAAIEDKTFYYGKIIDLNFLNSVSQKINADVVLFSDKVIIDVSNPQLNQELFFVFFNAVRELYNDNKYNIFSEESNSANILATLYKPFDLDNSTSSLSFLIFNKLEEYSQLKESLKNILIIIGIAGIILSVLLSYLFTIKIRKQINQLSSATMSIREGDFNVKVSMKGNDELTHLGDTFNLMVDKLRKNQKILSDYSDFITLLNQKSSLKEIAEVALNKIISTCNFSIGAIYLVEDNNNLKIISTHGISIDSHSLNDKTLLYQVIEKKKKVVLNFDSNIPSIKTGILDIKLNHLIIQPIIYSERVVAILELVSQFPLNEDIIDYLDKIQEQLAIGLINAKSVLQLENFVVELKKLNEELKSSNLQIVQQNEMLIKLSEALQNQAKELSIQKERAEESTKLKSQFLARVSHELKTPLNSIIGLTDLIIAKSDLDEKDKERLKVIQRSGKRLIDLINNLLDYSQIESGKLKPEFSEFSLNDFLNDIVFEMEPLVIQKKLRLVVNKKFDNDLKIYSDKEKLFQVFINLIGNAIKFTAEGFIDFTIIKEDTDDIKFIISDTGIGIADSEKEIIFEEFRQADGSSSRKFGGTGLGLSISKKIVELLGGNIWFESKLNFGTKFYVQIPLKSLSSSVKSTLDLKNILNSDKSSDNLVLVVDDDSDSLFTLTEILNSYGFRTTVARSGIECLKILENVLPDLILLDIMMPEMDGFQTIKKIKSDNRLNSIKIFAVTAKAMENARDVIANSGFDDCVFKPVNPIELIHKILNHLNKNLNLEYEKSINN